MAVYALTDSSDIAGSVVGSAMTLVFAAGFNRDLADMVPAAGSLVYFSDADTLAEFAVTANAALISGPTGVPSFQALTNGQLLVGSTGAAPSAATLTATANQTAITNAAGSITIGTVQDINTTSTPQFTRMGLGEVADATAALIVPYDTYISGKDSGGSKVDMWKVNNNGRVAPGAAVELGLFAVADNFSDFALITGNISSGEHLLGLLKVNTIEIVQLFASDADGSGLDTLGMRFANGAVIQGGKTASDVLKLSAYDVGGGAWFDVVTLTAGAAAASTTAVIKGGNKTDYVELAATGDIAFTDADGSATITGPAGGGLGMVSGGAALTQALQWKDSGGTPVLSFDDSSDLIYPLIPVLAGPIVEVADAGLVVLADMPVTGDDTNGFRIRVNGRWIFEASGIGDASGGLASSKTTVRAIDTFDNTIMRPLRILRETTDTTAAIGIGSGIEFYAETQNNVNNLLAYIDSETTAVGASPSGALIFKTVLSGAAPVQRVYIDHRGMALSGATAVASIETDVTGVFAITSGAAAPDQNLTDGFQVYSKDFGAVAGHAAPHFRTEDGKIIGLYPIAHVADATGDDAATQNAIRDALVTLGLMAGP